MYSLFCHLFISCHKYTMNNFFQTEVLPLLIYSKISESGLRTGTPWADEIAVHAAPTVLTNPCRRANEEMESFQWSGIVSKRLNCSVPDLGSEEWATKPAAWSLCGALRCICAALSLPCAGRAGFRAAAAAVHPAEPLQGRHPDLLQSRAELELEAWTSYPEK